MWRDVLLPRLAVPLMNTACGTRSFTLRASTRLNVRKFACLTTTAVRTVLVVRSSATTSRRCGTSPTARAEPNFLHPTSQSL